MNVGNIKEDYKSLINNIPGVIYTLDEDGNFTFVSESVQEILGYSADELVGHHFSDFLYPDDLQFVSRKHLLPRFNGVSTGNDGAPKLFDERRAFPRITNKLKVRFRPKEKKQDNKQILYCTVNSSGQYSTKKDGEKVFCGTTGIIFDVKEESLTFNSLEYSQYNVLDVFAQALSHAYCNIFTGIYGHLQLMEMHLEGNNRVCSNIEVIKNGIENAVSFIKHLASTMNESSGNMERRKLGAIIDEISFSMFPNSPVKVDCNYDSDLFEPDMDPDNIHHIIKGVFYQIEQTVLPSSPIQVSISLCDREKEFPRVDCKYLSIKIDYSFSGLIEERDACVSKDALESLKKFSSLALSYPLLKKVGGLLEISNEKNCGIVNLYLPVISK